MKYIITAVYDCEVKRYKDDIEKIVGEVQEVIFDGDFGYLIEINTLKQFNNLLKEINAKIPDHYDFGTAVVGIIKEGKYKGYGYIEIYDNYRE